MEIRFSSRKMQSICNSAKAMRKALGARVAEKLQQKLTELDGADTLDDVRRLPPARCHDLGQNRKGQLAVDLTRSKRLIFVPDHNPAPTKSDGGLDWTCVTRVKVIEIVDYHD